MPNCRSNARLQVSHPSQVPNLSKAFQERIAGDTQRGNVLKAADDAALGLALYPLWTRLGWNDILQRYRRSLLGPFWLTASMGLSLIHI